MPLVVADPLIAGPERTVAIAFQMDQIQDTFTRSTTCFLFSLCTFNP
jgi:hypothetical protein